MDDRNKIQGRIGTRVVGILEIGAGCVLFGIWIWVMIINTKPHSLAFQHTTFFVVLILFGIYFMTGIVGGFLLVYATCSHGSLKNRKRLSISWTFFRVVSFVGAVILMCATKWFAEIEWFMLMIGLILKWVVFICVVCTYIWGLSEVIEKGRAASSLASSVISFNAKLAQQQMQLQKIQEIQNYGAFAAKKQFC